MGGMMKVIEAIGKGFSVAGRSLGILTVLFIFNTIWNLVSLPFVNVAQDPQANFNLSPQFVVLSVLFILANVFIQGGVFGVIKDAIAAPDKNALGNFLKYGSKFYLRFLGMGAIILLGIALAVLIIGLIFSISLVVKIIIVNIIAVSISIILAAIALYYLFLLFLSPYILVIEDKGIFSAMKLSMQFVKKNLWKIAGLSTLLMLIGLGIGFLVGVLSGFISLVIKGAPLQIVAGILTSAVNAYIAVIISASLMIYYYGVAARKESQEPAAAA